MFLLLLNGSVTDEELWNAEMVFMRYCRLTSFRLYITWGWNRGIFEETGWSNKKEKITLKRRRKKLRGEAGGGGRVPENDWKERGTKWRCSALKKCLKHKDERSIIYRTGHIYSRCDDGINKKVPQTNLTKMSYLARGKILGTVEVRFREEATVLLHSTTPLKVDEVVHLLTLRQTEAHKRNTHPHLWPWKTLYCRCLRRRTACRDWIVVEIKMGISGYIKWGASTLAV